MLTLTDERTGTEVSAGVVLDVTAYGAGPAALLLSGVEGVRDDQEFVTLLGGAHAVLAPSHPGFDLSPRPDWLDSVEDLAYLYLDWLDRLDARDVTLVGCQFGGWVAAEMAVRSSARLSRLVLVDAVGIKPGGREERDIADVFHMTRGELDRRTFHDTARGPGDLTAALEDVVLRIARNEEALACYGWEPYLHNPRLLRWLHRISVPTLVVWGESDGIVTPGYGRSLAEAIPGARFEVIPDAGHRPQVEQPGGLSALIRDFSR
ncbi:MAG TPA: alpha/beta fold hydrolase [Trebonia sp.]